MLQAYKIEFYALKKVISFIKDVVLQIIFFASKQRVAYCSTFLANDTFVVDKYIKQ